MTATITPQDEAASFATYEAIANVLREYIDSARAGDSARMRRVFVGDASVRGSYGGAPIDWTLQDFCAVIEKGGPAPELNARIVTIDHAGSAAMACLEAENWRGTRYTDLFVLILRDGAWKISAKVFFAHGRA
jgi:hypothetical protein